MRLVAVLLFSLVVRPVRPIVVIPPHYHEFGWREWNAYIPPVESLRPESAGDRLAKFPRETFEVLHDLDQEVCVGGPAQPAEFPNVNRCVSLI